MSHLPHPTHVMRVEDGKFTCLQCSQSSVGLGEAWGALTEPCQGKGLGRFQHRNAVGGKPLDKMTDQELAAEWRHWDERISSATGWGAAVGAAHEFRQDCEREFRRRGIGVPKP